MHAISLAHFAIVAARGWAANSINARVRLTAETRLCRKRALLAAARHKTVTLPPLAGGRKHGMPNRYLVHDLLAAWQGFIDEGVDLPPLLEQHRGKD